AGSAVLVDAGALIALLDRSDAHHAAAVAALDRIREPLLTVWPALTEAMHLVSGVPRAPRALLDLVDEGGVELAELDRDDVARIGELMDKYADLPMDFADAALVRAAERHVTSKILTFDRHFEVYRLGRRQRFTIIRAR
ncbi:MAG: PIN domain-containing protein, partial [Acidobacteria bacterium]